MQINQLYSGKPATAAEGHFASRSLTHENFTGGLIQEPSSPRIPSVPDHGLTAHRPPSTSELERLGAKERVLPADHKFGQAETGG